MIRKVYESFIWKTGLAKVLPRLFWHASDSHKNTKLLYEEPCPKDFSLNFKESVLSESFKDQNEAWLRKTNFVIASDSVVIEPERGLAINDSKTFVKGTTNHKYIFPNRISYLLYRLRLKKVKKLDEVIHFDGYLSDNYYHFFKDVLSPLFLLESAGIDYNKPFVVGEHSFKQKHFQWLMKNNAWFASREWIVLDGHTYIKASRLYKSVCILPSKPLWEKSRALFNPPEKSNPERKIYLYRSPQFGRTVSNFNEIEPILMRYGFDCVDTGNMSLDAQMNLFADTKYLIAIHGAGITNVLFSNWESLSMVEILIDGSHVNTHYYWMASVLGIR